MTIHVAITRAKQRAEVLKEELLYWATEIGRAEEAGVATEMQVQAIRSAVVVVASEMNGLRKMLDQDVDLTDEDADAIMDLNRHLMIISDEYEALNRRSAKLFQPGTLTEPPLPTSFEVR